MLGRFCASGNGREGVDCFQKLRHTERKKRETKGGKEAHVPGWVRGGFGGGSSIWQVTADLLGINDTWLMMEVLNTGDLRFWKDTCLSSYVLPPPLIHRKLNMYNDSGNIKVLWHPQP